jgi:hypothetical protein
VKLECRLKLAQTIVQLPRLIYLVSVVVFLEDGAQYIRRSCDCVFFVLAKTTFHAYFGDHQNPCNLFHKAAQGCTRLYYLIHFERFHGI